MDGGSARIAAQGVGGVGPARRLDLPDLIHESAIRELADRGVPAIAGLSAAIGCAAALRGAKRRPARLREIAAAATGREPPTGRAQASEAEASACCAGPASGPRRPDRRRRRGGGSGGGRDRRLPVALKLSSAAVQHKSDVGALGSGSKGRRTLREPARLEVAAEAEILIERMVEPRLEVIVAARGDALVPALVIGLGGVWAEALDDISIVPLPASPERVERAIGGLWAAPLLTGQRGRARLDVTALAALAAQVGDLLLAERLELIELNPSSSTRRLRSPRRPGALMPAAIETVGVVGAGFMGSGIAESAARAGLPVVVHEPGHPALERSRERVERSVARAVETGKLDSDAAKTLIDSITWTDDVGALADSELVIEAVTGIRGQDVCIRDPRRRPRSGNDHRLNTSSIPIAQLAAATTRRESVIGLHFFSPVPVMKLVELVVGIDTSAETVERCEAFAERIGKRPIRTKDRSGFIVNMLLVPYLMAGVRMYEEGFAEREAIDEAMRLGCGHPMGPPGAGRLRRPRRPLRRLQLAVRGVQAARVRATAADEADGVSGHLGRKTGRGFYEYD